MSDLGLSIALSGIEAQAAGMNTASNDLANVGTAGYVREQVNLSPVGTNAVGEGVAVQSVTQVTNAVLDAGALAASALSAGANARSSVLVEAQAAFPEPGPSGLQAQLSSFWSSFDTLAATPSSLAARQQVVDQAQVVASTLNGSSGKLQGDYSQVAQEVSTAVARDNALLRQIAQLNTAVVGAQPTGGAAALVDQRSQLLGQLASNLGVTTSTQANGSLDVLLGSVTLVQGAHVTPLAATASTPAGTGSWSGQELGVSAQLGSGRGASAVALSPGGTVGGLLAAAGQVQGFQTQLDAVAADLAGAVNTALAAGTYYQRSSGSAGTTTWTPTSGGPPLFVAGRASVTTSASGVPAGLGASNISVNGAIAGLPGTGASGDLALIAAGGPPTGTPPAFPGPNDGTNAQALAALAAGSVDAQGNFALPGSPVNGLASPDASYQRFVGSLGTAVAGAQSQAQLARSQASAASAAQQGVSGVNPNEELTSMVQYQNAYQASAKALATIESTIQSLLSTVP